MVVTASWDGIVLEQTSKIKVTGKQGFTYTLKK